MKRTHKNPLVRKEDARPAGREGECFYCRQKEDTPHKDKCVILNRKVKVRYTFELEIEIPHHWNQHDIEFHRNDGSWCASNTIGDLSIYDEHLDNDFGVGGIGCMCSVFQCEVIDVPDAEPYVGTKFKKEPKPEEN